MLNEFEVAPESLEANPVSGNWGVLGRYHPMEFVTLMILTKASETAEFCITREKILQNFWPNFLIKMFLT